MSPAFAAILGLFICPTGIGKEKIDASALKTYGIAIVGFSIQDMSDRARFFEESLLLADTSMEIVLRMSFLAFNNANI